MLLFYNETSKRCSDRARFGAAPPLALTFRGGQAEQ
jgi:hypothetical protein